MVNKSYCLSAELITLFSINYEMIHWRFKVNKQIEKKWIHFNSLDYIDKRLYAEMPIMLQYERLLESLLAKGEEVIRNIIRNYQNERKQRETIMFMESEGALWRTAQCSLVMVNPFKISLSVLDMIRNMHWDDNCYCVSKRDWLWQGWGSVGMFECKRFRVSRNLFPWNHRN